MVTSSSVLCQYLAMIHWCFSTHGLFPRWTIVSNSKIKKRNRNQQRIPSELFAYTGNCSCITNHYQYIRDIVSLKFWSKCFKTMRKVFAKLLKNIEELFHRYYMHSDMVSMIISSITHWCVNVVEFFIDFLAEENQQSILVDCFMVELNHSNKRVNDRCVFQKGWNV